MSVAVTCLGMVATMNAANWSIVRMLERWKDFVGRGGSFADVSIPSLLVRSWVNLQRVHPGFSASTLTMRVSLDARYADDKPGKLSPQRLQARNGAIGRCSVPIQRHEDALSIAPPGSIGLG